MAFKKNSHTVGWLATATVAMLLIVAACSSSEPSTRQSTSAMETTATPTGIWSALMQRTPYPYTTPVPPANPTVLDGTYTKIDPYSGQHVPCKRCPAYPPGGGIWRLNLDKGIFRVHHEFTDWVTIGSFTVSEDTVSGGRIEFFNDPHCYQDTGVYTWKLEDGMLTLEVVEDNCGVYLRKQNLVALPWASCQPPSEEAATTNHWPVPPGCEGD